MKYIIRHIIATWLMWSTFCQIPPIVDQVPPKVHEITILAPIPIQNIKGFEDLVMDCSASGNPPPTISWSFNGVKFAKDQPFSGIEGDVVRHTLSGNRITIKNVKGQYYNEKEMHDTGRYRCIATNDVGAVFLEKYIKIRVMAKFNSKINEYSGATTEIQPAVGKSYEINCPAHRMGYGSVYNWGKVKTDRTVEYFRSGNPNERMFVKMDGTLVYSYVREDDITQSYDLGGLSCVISNFGQFIASNKHKFTQKSATRNENYPPNLVAHMPITMSAPVDTEYVMVCGATGRPLPVYRWEYQGVPIESLYPGSEKLNFEFFEFYGNKMELRIRRLTTYSGGTFRCYAKNSLGEVHESGQLKVLFPPKWKDVFPDTVEVAFENRYVLVCNATGFPRPKFEWFQNGTRLTSREGKTVTGTGPGDNGGILNITRTSFKDNGIYICVAYNELDTLTMSIYVKISQMKPKFEVPLSDPLYLFESATMQIECNPIGGPIPINTWKKNGIDIKEEGRFKIHEANGSLQISNVQASDAGTYRCTATNDFGTDYSEGTAVVLKPTVITNPIQSNAYSVGWGYAVLYCGASWDPRLDLRIEWYKGGVRMAKFSNRIYLEKRVTGPPRLLYLNNLTVEDAGEYSCHAYTTVGNVISDSWSYGNLTIKAPPEPPTGLTIVGDCYTKKATLTWQRGEEIGVETRRFYIEFSTNQSSHADKWFGGEGDELIPNSVMVAKESGRVIEFKLDDYLVPGANLIFRIKAASDQLIGRPSRSTKPNTCSTPTGKPVLNPVNVTAIIPGSGELIISWRPLTDVYFGASDFQYEVNYKLVESTVYTQQLITDLNQTQYAISSPGVYKQYQFFVLSKNILGYGPDNPKVVTAYSGREAPKSAPNNFAVVKITQDNIEFTWTRVEDADGYRVRYWNITDAENLRGRSGRSKRAISDPIVYKYQTFIGQDFDNGATISNLTAQVAFLASVAAVNNGGVGPESGLVQFTSSARIPGRPSNVHLQVYGRSIHVNWNPPVEPNGYIESYEIAWGKSAIGNSKKERVTMDRRSREAYLINKLEPMTYYDLYLSARNRLGPGRVWDRILVTVSAEDIPGKPAAPKAVPFDDSAINVTFQRPTYGGLPSLFYVYYRPTGHYFHEPKRVSQAFPQRAWMLIVGLDFLVYDFWTVGINSMGQSETSDVTVQQPIRRPKPQAHASEFEWYESNWFIAIGMCMLFLLITVIVVVILLRSGPKTYKRLKDESYSGYSGNRGAQEMKQVPTKSTNGNFSAGAGAISYDKDKYDDRRQLSTSDAPSEHDVPPPRYSSQSSIEKKRQTASEDGSQTGSGSDYSDSGSATGSDYSDEEDGSYYSDEEKKRDSEDDDGEEDLSTFV